jgi:integrase
MAHFRRTNEALIAGHEGVKGFPLILNNSFGVHWVSLRYFLSIFSQGVSLSSVHTYAQHIFDFINQLEHESGEGAGFDQVYDAWLVAYRDAIISRGNTENYASQVLRSCIAFLMWLEEEKYICMVVGEGALYKVRVRRTAKGVILHPTTRCMNGDKRKSVAPRAEWIDIVKEYGPVDADLAARFELMIDWGAVLQLRAHEICALTISQLPELLSAENAIRDGRFLDITLVVTKGGRSKTIPVSPLLVKNTWDFIFSSRQKIVNKFKKFAAKKRRSYSEPSEIFLSDKTGRGLSPASLSNAVRAAFLKAVEDKRLTVDERVWLHGLRHKGILSALRRLDAEGVERPEAVVRQISRHASNDAMEPYLTDRFNRDFHE